MYTAILAHHHMKETQLSNGFKKITVSLKIRPRGNLQAGKVSEPLGQPGGNTMRISKESTNATCGLGGTSAAKVWPSVAAVA